MNILPSDSLVEHLFVGCSDKLSFVSGKSAMYFDCKTVYHTFFLYMQVFCFVFLLERCMQQLSILQVNITVEYMPKQRYMPRALA